MSFLLNLALKIKQINIRNIDFLLGSLIMFIIVSLEEMTQLFIASRTFDLIDLFFNYLGIFVFSILAKFVGKYIWTDEKSINQTISF
jgi:VanZ family protein